jgi:hypothetical protein
VANVPINSLAVVTQPSLYLCYQLPDSDLLPIRSFVHKVFRRGAQVFAEFGLCRGRCVFFPTFFITNVLCCISQNRTAPSASMPSALSLKLLQHHLTHTTISCDNSGISFAHPTALSSSSTPRSLLCLLVVHHLQQSN